MSGKVALSITVALLFPSLPRQVAAFFEPMISTTEKIQLWETQSTTSPVVTDEVIKNMISHARLVSLPAGTPVFRPESNCENYLLVTRGSVKVSLNTLGGNELLLYRVHAGESCVLTTTCLMAAKPYPAQGVTETEVTALMIPKQYFDQALAASENFRQIVFGHLSSRFADIIGRIEAVKFSGLDTRLVGELIRQADGENKVSATHQTLANEIGSSREVVSRHLKELEKQGLIKLGRGRIELLQIAPLKKIAVEDL